MTLGEAAAVLGLDADGPFEPVTLRRSYLAAVKRCNPEVDPAGFMRLREAYETLRSYATFSAAMATEPAPEQTSTPAAAPPPTVPPVARDDDRRRRWQRLHDHPRELPADELAGLGEQGSRFERLLVAAAYLERDQPIDAVAIIEKVLDGDVTDRQTPFLVYQALRSALALHQRGEVALASRVFAAVKRLLGPTGLTVDIAGGETTILNLLCAELESLPELPRDIRQDLAAAALAGDLRDLSATTRAFVRAHGAREARRLRDELARKAPTIASLLPWNNLGRPAIATVIVIAFLSAIGLLVVNEVLTADANVPAQPLIHGLTGRFLHLESDFHLHCRERHEAPVCATLHRAFIAAEQDTNCRRLNTEKAALEAMSASAPAEMAGYLREVVTFFSVLCAP
jgi:hypothetical protein